MCQRGRVGFLLGGAWPLGHRWSLGDFLAFGVTNGIIGPHKSHIPMPIAPAKSQLCRTPELSIDLVAKLLQRERLVGH